jgi:uncharacterized protein YbjT (DUF2867 family)
MIHVIGASGRSGAALCRELLAGGEAFVPVVRNAARWHATGLPGVPRIADLYDPAALLAALADSETVLSCAHARHAGAILAAAPGATKFVFLGSTRKFTRWPDEHGNGVLAGEAAFLAAGRPGVMLHPTMIYGAEGEDNVQRLAALLRRLPLVPLPGGGKNLIQPIHQSDVTACLRAAIARDWDGPSAMIIAGPRRCTYAEFVRDIARCFDLPPPRLVPVPIWLLMAVAPLTRLPGLPTITADEIRRLAEDKAFATASTHELLGRAPMDLADGLRLSFRQG